MSVSWESSCSQLLSRYLRIWSDILYTRTVYMFIDGYIFTTHWKLCGHFYRLEVRDNTSVYLILGFEPTGFNVGYCRFTIEVYDKRGGVYVAHLYSNCIFVWLIAIWWGKCKQVWGKKALLTRGHFAERGDTFKVYGERCALRNLVGMVVHCTVLVTWGLMEGDVDLCSVS